MVLKFQHRGYFERNKYLPTRSYVLTNLAILSYDPLSSIYAQKSHTLLPQLKLAREYRQWLRLANNATL